MIHSSNLETILALKPDLVVGVNVSFHNTLISMLEKAGIPIVIQPLDIPVGIFMAFLGAPFFLYLLKKGMSQR